MVYDTSPSYWREHKATLIKASVSPGRQSFTAVETAGHYTSPNQTQITPLYTQSIKT